MFLSLLILILFCVSGEKGTLTHGSVVNGRFEGFIKTYQGTYYVEPSERYLKDKSVAFHSVIYHEDDVGKFLSLHSLHRKCREELRAVVFLGKMSSPPFILTLYPRKIILKWELFYCNHIEKY